MALLLACAPGLVFASLGPFEHGNGIKSQGAGGVGYALGEESTALIANPALIAGMDRRSDAGASFFIPNPAGELEGNLLGPNREYRATGQRVYPIPQGGLVRHLDDRWSLGMSLFAAGLGPDYKDSPYQRFGGSQRSSLTLVSSGVSTALALRLTPEHAIAAAINLGYQVIRVEGVEFLGIGVPPVLQFSEQPDKVSNQGYDGRPTIGFTLGWQGLITPRLALGAAYRSKNWTPKHKDYSGLLPEAGRLELPAIWGLGLAWMPVSQLTLAADVQHYENEDEKALGNGIAQLRSGNLLGSDNGPGFGFKDQTAYKFGAVVQASQAWTLRAGYIHANQPVQTSDTLFPILAGVAATTHYTRGLTWQRRNWEVSGFAAYAPKQTVRGENSIPLLFGGGEANVSFEVVSVGFSIGWGIGE